MNSHSRQGVILLHGLALGGWIMQRLALRLRRQGYRVLVIGYPSRRLPLADIAALVLPRVTGFAAGLDRVHFVGHSLGGLVIRSIMKNNRPANAGRVVMIGTPNHGSEISDALQNIFLYKWFFGPVGQELTTAHDYDGLLGAVDYEAGVIAGSMSAGPIAWIWDMPLPHDGKVTVASTHAAGEADHIVLPVTHTLMPLLPGVISQVISFLRNGAFRH